MSVINTNVKSLVARNAMTANNRSLSTAMQQLSTGKRINSAKDDAAGLAISTKMTTQIRGLNQAVRNANDGISMLQTAEGALNEVTNMLQRMRELSVQSANDTNTAEERDFMDLEFQALKSEINRIGTNTQWNGTNILDGSKTDVKFQVGASALQTIDVAIGNMQTGTATTTAFALTTASGPAAAQVSDQNFTTIAGAAKVGDLITIRVGDQKVDYTVTTADLAGATTAADAALIATSVFTAVGSNFTGITASNGTAGQLTLTANAVNTPFTANTTHVANSGSFSGIADDDVKTRANANFAIGAVDGALKAVNTERAKLGASINRLTYTADNLTNVAQNTTESRSRIEDTDYAAATTELARTQIIQQAATAMLAQANQQPQGVLSLLQG